MGLGFIPPDVQAQWYRRDYSQMPYRPWVPQAISEYRPEEPGPRWPIPQFEPRAAGDPGGISAALLGIPEFGVSGVWGGYQWDRPAFAETQLEMLTAGELALGPLEIEVPNWWTRWFWGADEMPATMRTEPVATTLVQMAKNLTYRWGLEILYEIPKLIERPLWMVGYTPAEQMMDGLSATFGHATSASELGVLSTLGTAGTLDMIHTADGRIRKTATEDWYGLMREGEIGYTFAMAEDREERLAAFREDIAAGVTYEEAVARHQDLWTEFAMNFIFDPAWLIPGDEMAKVTQVIFPAGYWGTRGAVAGAGAIWRNTLGRIKLGRILSQSTKASTVHLKAGEAADLVGEAFARSTGDLDFLDTANRFLGGNTDDLAAMSPRSRRAMDTLIAELHEANIRSVDDIVSKLFPELRDYMTQGRLQMQMRRNPTRIRWLVGEAQRRRVAAQIDMVPLSEKGAVVRSLHWISSLLKEAWLGINPAYVMGNLSDNFNKGTLAGHHMNPFELDASTKIAGLMDEFGTVVPMMVDEGLTAAEFAPRGLSHAQIPFPGIGKPVDILDSLSSQTGKDLRAIWSSPKHPVMRRIMGLLPERAGRAELMFGLAEQPSAAASMIDQLNWATLVDKGGDLTSSIENTARAQIFWSQFTKEMAESQGARLSLYQGLELSDDIYSRVSRMKNPRDILLLADTVYDEIPVTRLSSLRPEGIGDEVDMLDAVAREMDRLQDQALKFSVPSEGQEWLFTEADGLLDVVDNNAQTYLESGYWGDAIANWRAQKMAEAARGALTESRSMLDELMGLTHRQARANPEMAHVYWGKYHSTKSQNSAGVMRKVYRMFLNQDLGVDLSDETAAVLRNTWDIDPQRVLGLGASGTELEQAWGPLGEKVARLRLHHDAALLGDPNSGAYGVLDYLLESPTQERLLIVGNILKEADGVWGGYASQVANYREGFWIRAKTGKFGLKGSDAYQLEMERAYEEIDRLWTAAFNEVTDLYLDGANSLRLGTETEQTMSRLAQMLPDDFPEWATSSRAWDILEDATPEEMQQAIDAGLVGKNEAQKIMAQKAQSGHELDLAREAHWRWREEATVTREAVDAWRATLYDAMPDTVNTYKLADADAARLQISLRRAAERLSTDVQDASLGGTLEVKQLLNNYGENQQWEQLLRVAFPFTKWQINNPITWARLIRKNPQLLRVMQQYVAASEEERQARHLTSRFEHTFPLPGQEWLQERGVLPEGYYGVNPVGLLSITSQFGEPYQSPGEEELTGAEAAANWALRLPEYLGARFWPWFSEPARAAGLYGNAPPSSFLGAPGRVIPGVRRFEERVGQRIAPGSDWNRLYAINRTLAEMENEGLITEYQAAAAQFNPEDPIYKQAEERSNRIADRLSQWRFMVPFGMKYASPGELGIREVRDELRDMPEAQAAQLRSQTPGYGAYGRAIASVQNPEYARWKAQQDAIYAQYDEQLRTLTPWDPRTRDIEQARRRELDQLGPAPARVRESGYEAGAGTAEDLMFQLEQGRPMAEEFAGPDGEIDWKAYYEAQDAYEAEMGPETLRQYTQFRNRYDPNLARAWELRQGELGEGYDWLAQAREEYGAERERLGEQRIPRDWLATQPTGLTPAEYPEYQDPDSLVWSQMRDQLLGQAEPELRDYLLEEYNRRRGADVPWSDRDFVEWAQGEGIPYQRQQEMLGEYPDPLKEGYGPVSAASMWDSLREERPWLPSEAPAGWHRPGMQMPGMTFGEGEEPLIEAREEQWWEQRSQVLDRYYSLMPQQKNFVERRLPEGVSFKDWVDSRRATPDVWGNVVAPWQLLQGLPTPPDQERLQAEVEHIRYLRRGRAREDWTPLQEKWYGDPEASKNLFWDLRNSAVWNETVREDEILSTILDADIRDAYQFTEEQYATALEYLQENYDKFVDQDAMDLAAAHPEFYELAQQQKALVDGWQGRNIEAIAEEYREQTIPRDVAAWKEENPQEWALLSGEWDNQKRLKVQNPYYTWMYRRDDYEAWWGDTPPDQIDVDTELEEFEGALRQMDEMEVTGGTWTQEMRKWFGGAGVASDFWAYWFANKDFISKDIYDDDIVQAALAKGVRELIDSEAMEPIFEEALKLLPGYYDHEKKARWDLYPEIWAQGRREYREYQATWPYDQTPDSGTDAADVWYDSRKRYRQTHPMMTYLYYYDNYVRWWGESPPTEAGPVPPPKGVHPVQPAVPGGGGPGGGPVLPPPPPPPPPPPSGGFDEQVDLGMNLPPADMAWLGQAGVAPEWLRR